MTSCRKERSLSRMEKA